jgi:hypothetical protein
VGYWEPSSLCITSSSELSAEIWMSAMACYRQLRSRTPATFLNTGRHIGTNRSSMSALAILLQVTMAKHRQDFPDSAPPSYSSRPVPKGYSTLSP